MASLPQQPAPMFAKRKYEPVARFSDVAHLISSGDLIQYTGSMWNPVSASIRFATYSQWSHSGIAYRDGESLYVIDICAADGCQIRPLYQQVRDYPGRYCWSHVSRRRFPEFDGEACARAALADVGKRYGYRGVSLQLAMSFPIARELAYLLRAHEWSYFSDAPSFCSQGVKKWATAGGVDPVPNRAPQLCPPREMGSSLLWTPKYVALMPNEWEGNQ